MKCQLASTSTLLVCAKATSAALQTQGVFLPGISEFFNSQPATNSKLKAYLNWILLDEQFKLVPAGSGFLAVPGFSANLRTLAESNISMAKSVYLVVYVSNETERRDVFFDNIVVKHEPGPLLEETHYYPFGLVMSGISSKAFQSSSPDCGCPSNKKGFNGNEIQNKEFTDGSGLELYDFNARTYDQQIGRFIQVDPKGEDGGQESLTLYQFSLNNPIRYNDPDGQCPICPFIPFIIKAFVAGAAIDAGTQVVSNKIQGQSWGQSLNNVSLTQSAVSGGFSVLSGGASNFVGGTKVATTVTKAFIQTGLETGESVVKQSLQPGGNVTWQQTLSDVAMDKAGGMITKNVNSNGINSAEKKLDRANRVAEGDPTSSGRQQNLRDAGNNLTTQQTKAAGTSDAVGNGLQEVSNGVRNTKSPTTNFIYKDPNPHRIDNTQNIIRVVIYPVRN